MTTMPDGWAATLIGDLVASRRVADRRRLQRELEGALSDVNRIFDPPHPLRPTVGDEFQGGFRSVAEATRASLLLRLVLFDRGEVDSRYGLGYGPIAVLEGASPGIEDGPGWWSARGAIDLAKLRASSPRTSFVRTGFDSWWRGSESVRLPDAPAMNAFLVCRDAIVDQMTPRSRRNLLGTLRGQSQAELAEREQVTQSAISQDLGRSGAFAVEAAQRYLEEALV
jgi:hypothetical protein